MMVLCACAEIAASFIECYIFMMICSQLFLVKKRKTELFASFIGAFLCFSLNRIEIYSVLTVIIMTVFYIISSWLLFRQKILYHFDVSCFYSLCLGLLDFLVASILLSMENGVDIVAIILAYGLPRITFLVIMKGILTCVFLMIRPLLEKVNLNTKGMRGTLIISLGGYVGYVFLVRQTLSSLSDGMLSGWLFWSMFVVLFIIIVLLIIDAKDKKTTLMHERIRGELLEQNYQNVSDIYKQNAKLYHDVNHHLNALYQLINGARYEDAKAYIEKISEPVKQLSKTSWTGIHIVDVVLNSKAEQMKQKGITYQYNVEFPENTNVLSNDICTIFANLIDNAIEATEKILPTEKTISVSVRKVHDFIIIQVENPCEAGIVFDSELPRTTKQDTDIHGWGLPSVISAVEKYNGTFHCSVENEIFTATAMLCLEKVE